MDGEVTVTPRAAARAAELLRDAGLAGGGLQVSVQSAGCDGFQALLDLAAQPADGEIELVAGGIRLFADVPSTLRLPGAVLDYVRDERRAEFVWSHPDSERGCSCAEADLAALRED